LIVVEVELSSTKVREVAGAAKLKLPEPSVVNTWPSEPSEPGKVNAKSLATLFGAFSETKWAPLFVPSLNLIVPPTVVELPTLIAEIAEFESAVKAELAVNVPSTWSNLSAKYWPPMTVILLASPLPSTPPSPILKWDSL
jgi:hypothetical protein